MAAGWVVAIAVGAGLIGLLCGFVGGLVVGAVCADAGWTSAQGSAEEILPERLPELMSFVEERIGARFSETPQIEMLDDDAFVARLLEEPTSGPEVSEYDDFASTAVALGLASDADDLSSQADEWFADGVVGFYDQTTDELAVRGTAWSPFVETTLVHELVHALQDQKVDLDAATRATHTEDESYLALSTLVEGQATVVESDWLTAQGSDYEDAYFGFEPPNGSGALPTEPLVDVLAALPYDLGYDAVTALEADGGAKPFWTVLGNPPTTLEQVWDLPGWLDGEPLLAGAAEVPEVPVPDDGELVDRGSLGVHLLSLLTLEDWYWLEDGPVEGWAGDRYATWTEGSGGRERACTRVDVAVDDGARAPLEDAFRGWVDGGGSVTTGNDGQLVLERCGPRG
jgi:hypothetical protein